MDSSMSNSISDQLHVAQQSRREKLRVQHCSSPVRSSHQVDDYTSGLEVILPVFNPGLYQVGDNVRNASNFLYQPAGTSSELLLNFSSSIYNSSIKSAEDDHGPVAVNCTNLASSDVNCSRKPGRESNLENFGVWKSIGSYSNSDNWNTDCDDRYRKNTSLGIESDSSASGMRSKHRAAIRCQNHFQYGEMNFGSQMNYSNALNDEVTTALVGLQPDCRVSGNTCMSWGNHGRDKEHNHIVPCGYQSDRELILSGSTWNREMNSMHSRLDQLVVDSHSQGLSLSLCSNPATSMIAGSQFEDVHIPQSKPLQEVANNCFHDSIPFNPTNYCVRPAGVGQGNSLQKPVGPSANYHQQTGPLGPFTGYATILKNSRFLKPAQQLLDEYCGVIGKFSSCSTPVISDRNTVKVDDLATAVNSIESEVGSTGVILGVSTSTHQDSDEIIEGAASSQGESYQPDYQLKQAKLLYMLEEVSRRYKQYYQQMQLVASAFESVAGLAAATPYISSALRTVARHFNHLKNAISDQLRHIKTFLGEDFSLTACGIRKKGDLNTKRLKFTDHSFQKQKSGGSITGLIEPQQHIWRPQRGLPERAVSVLKAWLFEHFLHPYPTDTDKLMLATQTGLTRSQVSNWFINARVRLWKPMVEEIHMLERKGLSESDAVDNDNVSSNGVDPHLKADHSMNTMVGTSVPNANLECSGMGSLSEMADAQVAKQWNREPRSQVNNHIMNCMDQGKMSVSPYHQTGQEMSGIGSISLTLGLRQSADQMYLLDGSQHPHPHSQYFQQQQQDRIRQHLGGHTVHEYAG